MIGVPTSLVTIGKDLGHLKEAKNVDTSTVQAGMIIGEQMTETDISLVDRDQGKLKFIYSEKATKFCYIFT